MNKVSLLNSNTNQTTLTLFLLALMFYTWLDSFWSWHQGLNFVRTKIMRPMKWYETSKRKKEFSNWVSWKIIIFSFPTQHFSRFQVLDRILFQFFLQIMTCHSNLVDAIIKWSNIGQHSLLIKIVRRRRKKENNEVDPF